MRIQHRCYDCEYCKYSSGCEIFYCTQNKLRNKLNFLLGLKAVNEAKKACKKALIDEKQR